MFNFFGKNLFSATRRANFSAVAAIGVAGGLTYSFAKKQESGLNLIGANMATAESDLWTRMKT